ncbi:MAG TPA: hypothetical protein VLL54_10900 [Pyrinomonadaceae bacterium]|nr:hypothetical protein [Pyrinomonadaceae bacterium]
MNKRQLILAFMLVVLTNSIAFPKTPARSWLRGRWEGTGYQTDDDSTWPMRLSITSSKRGTRVFSIDYPSLDCGGNWKLLKFGQGRAIFQEQLSHGQDKCTDKGLVYLERKNRKQAVYLYRIAGGREFTAAAVLNRKQD